jgi:chromobox protein 1
MRRVGRAALTGTREGAQVILETYYDSIGGRDFIMRGGGKAKRGRPSQGKSTPPAKRAKAERATGATTAAKADKPYVYPSGSWEEHVRNVETLERTNEGDYIFLAWNDGHMSKHPKAMVYKRCPQKMLQFYEAHM